MALFSLPTLVASSWSNTQPALPRPTTSRPTTLSRRHRLLRCISAVPAGVEDFIERAAINAANAVEWRSLALSPDIADGPVEASFIRTRATDAKVPIVLLHSFDSSCLEWRRVLPQLDAAGLEAYALDSLGWGFGDTRNVVRISVDAKRDHLRAFLQQVLGGRPATLVGSSLGAATIIDFVAAYPTAVASVVMIDPQGFIDGAPPVPRFAARAGIRLLRSWPLRSLGQCIAYEDLATFATDDAIRVGRLHCARDRWEEDQMEWLASGGYSVSKLVPRLGDAGRPCLLLWGRQDRVLPPAEYVPRFLRALPACTFRWVERCGHVPHLEQSAVVGDAIIAFHRGEPVAGDADTRALTAAPASSSPLEIAAPASSSPLESLNSFLDRPFLDTNERGGAFEPLKKLIRAEPELAQVLASMLALAFFGAVGIVIGRLATGTLL
jgi:pimeloyl-ACP methyl ester carboxylesterase